MSERIEGPISRIETKVKHGKLKHKKIELKTDVSKDVDNKTAEILNDTVNPVKRDEICREARLKAESPVAKVKRKISKEIGRDLGLKMS